MKRRAVNATLVLISLLIALAATELALRFFVGKRQHQRELQSMLIRSQNATPEPGSTNVSLRGLIRPSANDRLVYELKPGLRANFIGVPVAINQIGFREREISASKPKGTFRIVGLGDSFAFGWGVPVEATYLRVLERLLQDRGDPLNYETLNFGVPGYNAAMEVELFKSITRKYEPDLLIVGIVGNDADLPNFMKQSTLDWPHTSYLYNLVVHGAAVMKNNAWELRQTMRWDFAKSRAIPFEEVPPQFRHMVGLDAVRRSYAELARITRVMNIPVVMVGDYSLMVDPTQVAALEAHSQFMFMEWYSHAYERRHDVKIVPKDIQISPTDTHPNILGHAVIAEGIYQALVDRRLIPPAGTMSRR